MTRIFLALLSFALPCLLQAASPLRGYILIPDKSHIVPSREAKQMEGVVVIDVDLPGSLAELRNRLFAKPYTTNEIREVKQVIYQYYQDQARPIILVDVPPQNLKEGVLQLVIKEGVLGKVQVEGNTRTPASLYLNYLRLETGKPISQKVLFKDVDFMNRNPYRRVDVIYSPSERELQTDLTLRVQEGRPYHFYMGFENTGVPTTGRQRVRAGFNWDHVFNQDHTFFYQYTTNYDSARFHAHTFQYTAFLPWRDVVSIFGGFSIVHAHFPLPERKNKGTNINASLRYTIPLNPISHFSHAISAGFDLKQTNNTMEFVDATPIFGQTVNMTQWIAEYEWQLQLPNQILEGGAQCYISPFAWIPNQTNFDFASLRPEAKNQWIYVTSYFHLNRPLPYSCSWDLYLKGQISSTPLLPSEQLGLGGFGSVRGYDSRQYNADTGLVANLELRSPSFFGRKTIPWHGHFLLFLDGGLGYDLTKVPSFRWFDTLLGVGPGIRLGYSPYFTARFDWGFKLHQQSNFTGGSSEIYFNLAGMY